MKTRHAAALALVGWYLIMPHRPGDSGEPFSQWYQSEEFDTDAECNQLLEYDRGVYRDNKSKNPVVQEQIRRLRYAQCVAANDPRLKSNALVGWYLMMPLSWSDSLAEWHRYGSFDSAVECAAARENAISTGVADSALIGLSNEEVKRALVKSECIATNDPRLTRK
jgi:hypothetical protein